MKSRLTATVFALLMTMQPGRADQAHYEAAMIVQTGLNRTGDYHHAIDGVCGPLMADAANRYMIRNKEIEENEKADVFCDLLSNYYFLVFKGKENFTVERELGFETIDRGEVDALFKACGRQAPAGDVDLFADGSRAAMFGVFETILETPAEDDEVYRCMLKRKP